MQIRRSGFAATGVGLSCVVAAILLLPVDRESSPASASAAQEEVSQDLDVSPDTMVGWERGPQQPILFSHRRHAGAYQIDCLYCHSNADRSPYAEMPSVELCLGCHRVVKAGSPEIEKLRGYWEREEPIPWVRIYSVGDFVQFNHARHVTRDDIECQNCHGNVEETDVLYRATPMTMGWCLECHREPADSAQMAQAEARARTFEKSGRESHGLYPRSIDSDYGVTRGPIDCVACHY